ncbi:hypothetical protein K443DRAFT_4039 [Laccaria amethystina LaAM-08-1]|uniref:Uncharacterized protein n=1 Tax=Laccaria amethystina LaAM-08-1 TaxID=1095629 RepID=A0A0C9XJI1_9AGAR|nr:hypothetical protein K443DRAFT_4039 [Laccaria amethystina LaAM-08-1]
MPITIRIAHVFRALQGVTGLDPVAAARVAPFNEGASDPGELLDQDDNNEDEEDSQEKDKENKAPSVVPATPCIRKCECAASVTPATILKKKKLTGAASTIDGLSQSIGIFGDKVFERNINAVDAYLALDRDDEGFFQMWIEDKLESIENN